MTQLQKKRLLAGRELQFRISLNLKNNKRHYRCMTPDSSRGCFLESYSIINNHGMKVLGIILFFLKVVAYYYEIFRRLME